MAAGLARRLLRALLLATIAFALLIAASHVTSKNWVQIRNLSGATLEDCEVEVGGHRLPAGDIAPGHDRWVGYVPQADSAIRMTCVAAGQPRSCAGDVYVTGGFRDDLRVQVTGLYQCAVDYMGR